MATAFDIQDRPILVPGGGVNQRGAIDTECLEGCALIGGHFGCSGSAMSSASRKSANAFLLS